ncbi:hypothetical protein ABFV99_13725 [Cytobacillus horneckiae]|uniref:hypothetical protein n=1 Tax=Cytobacillus horneckiae TaxID=549687 RepID=UPI0034D0033E
MLKFSSDQIRETLKVYRLIKKFDIADESLIHYLKHSVTSDGDLYLHGIADACEILFEFDFEYVQVPEQILEDYAENGLNYYILGAVHIPAILPYTEHPAFIEFTRHLEIIENSVYEGNLVEFVYLPDSVFASSTDSLYQYFGRQPATFMMGMQDNGGLDLESTVQFLLELKEVNNKIIQLIRGTTEGGESAA